MDNNWLLKFCYDQQEYRQGCIEIIRNPEQAWEREREREIDFGHVREIAKSDS